MMNKVEMSIDDQELEQHHHGIAEVMGSNVVQA